MERRAVNTAAGGLLAVRDPGTVWRVGYRPNPWAWTPWEYAGDNGRFDGRWDDPAGTFRTVYAASDLLSCLLEVLARFRVDPFVSEDLAAIEEDPDDAAQYPTQAPGTVPLSWLEPRLVGTAILTGTYCAVTDKESIPTLRSRFLPLALSNGLADLDAGTLRLMAPRSVTQQVAGWLYDIHDGARPLFDGVQFRSRHGDGLTLWAVFEREDDGETSKCLREPRTVALNRGDPAIMEAFRLHRLAWG